MVELIHTSDWHLGNPFSAFSSAQQETLSEARFEAISAIFTYAREHGVSLVLSAGDQIDNGELRDTRVLLRLFGLIASFPDIRVVMISGNHDPYTPSSVYSRIERSSYPKNLLFVERPQAIELPELGVRILAAPLCERFGRVNPIVELSESEARAPGEGESSEGMVTIGLAHGSVAVSDTVGGGDAFPIPPALAEEQGIDYLALGDWHSYLAIGERTYYPGTHEPLAFGDDGGSLHVRIGGPQARPEITRVGGPRFDWKEIRRTLSDENLDAFLEELDPPASGGRGGERKIVRLALDGYLSYERFKRLEERLAMNEAALFAQFTAGMPEVRPSEEELREIASEGYMPHVVDRLVELAGGGDERADAALLRLYSFFRASTGGGGSR